MSKSKRGKLVKKTANWRGTCPICNRTGVKLLWDKILDKDDKKVTLKVCKVCGNK